MNRIHKNPLIGLVVCLVFAMSAWAVRSVRFESLEIHQPGHEYYVNPKDGNDLNNGSLVSPWRTIKHALNKIKSGDTVYLRSGLYREANLYINKVTHGTEPIRIKGFEGETAIIDGSLGGLQGVNDSTWKLIDKNRQVYEIMPRFRAAPTVHGVLETSMGYHRLVNYKSYEDLSSDNEDYDTSGSIYVGPGFFYAADSGKLYIRLVGPKSEPASALFDPTLTQNPSNHSIHFSPQNYCFVLNCPGSIVEISNLTMIFHYASIKIMGGSNIRLERLTTIPTKHSIIINENVQGVAIKGCRFQHGIPKWVAWSDVKHGKQTAHSLQSNVIEIKERCKDILIENNSFLFAWDGIDALKNVNNLQVRNNYFEGIRDDCIQLGSDTWDVDIDDNKMIRVFTGIGRHGSGTCPRPGTKYIHHNVIDTTEPMLTGRKDPKKLLKYDQFWSDGSPLNFNLPLGAHSYDDTGLDPYKIYNNTFVFGRAPNRYGAGHTLSGKDQSSVYKHEVYNNIFIQIHDGEIGRNASCNSGSETYDGNVYYRKANIQKNPLFYDYFCEGKRESYDSFSDYMNSCCKSASSRFYNAGWDDKSIYADPRLDEKYRPSADGPAGRAGVPLSSSWPKSANSHYRGAIRP